MALTMDTIFDDRGLILHSDSTRVLVITDIHLGYEIELTEKSGAVFPLQHAKMLERLSILVDKYKIDCIYIIGDVKHTINVDSYYNWEVVPEFIGNLSKLAKVVIVPGNHDGDLTALLPRDVTVNDVHGLVINSGDTSVGLLHGHAWPSSELLETKMLVVGHNHPSVRRLKDVSVPEIGRSDRYRSAGIVPVVIRSKLDTNCVRKNQGMLEIDSGDNTLVTLPSFNDLISGIHVNRPNARFLGPLFENSCADLLSSEVYSSEGIFLGTVEMLQNQFTTTK